MIKILLFFWIVSAFFLVREQKVIRMIIYLVIFSLLSSACFLVFSAPDVAMAEAVIGAFSIIIFIVSFEKYYSFTGAPSAGKMPHDAVKKVLSLAMVIFLFAVFIMFNPGDSADSGLKKQYLSMFPADIGGENAVTAIYLGYRMYDTLMEALMLLVSVVAVVHLSQHREHLVLSGKRRDINKSDIAVFTVRIISPVLILFSAYLIMNGHVSPGGGFQGGVVLASFFMCRYMIHAIHDININKVIMFEKFAYLGIFILASFFIFYGAHSYLPLPKSVYLVSMNLFIGLKVSCGFLIIFYRFITFEWR